MNRDKKILYLTSSLTVAVLFAAFFLTANQSKIVCACFLLPVAVLIRRLIRKRKAYSIRARSVFFLTALLGILFVTAILLSGEFFGIYKNPYFVNTKVFFRTILPLAVLIVSSEVIRATFLAQKNGIADTLAYVACVLTEILAFSGIAGIHTVNHFMDLVGLTLFPAISTNLYYHYLSKNYGMASPIAFRLITALYIYVVPTVSAMSDALLSLAKIFLPLLFLALTAALFETEKKKPKRKSKFVATVATVVAFLIVSCVIVLVSCQFRYGAMVIATGSMTGEINRGDVIIYERYEDQKIEEGQVIVFIHYENNVVHRVIKIENVNGERRYYTKGDANPDQDAGYRTDEDIVGLTDLKIAYVGYPTLWLHDVLSSGQPQN